MQDFQDFRIDGVGKIPGGSFGRLVIDGVGECAGDLEVEALRVDGTFKCGGAIAARRPECGGAGERKDKPDTGIIKVNGSFKCRGAATAKEFECDGSARVDGDLHTGRLLVDGLLTMANGAKLEADEVICDGSISMDGQICADAVWADGLIRAREIVGDRIIIKSRLNALAKFFTKGGSKVDLIEATYIELCGVTAETVNGSQIVIGPKCQIENLDCNGTLSIDPTSIVKNITGEYTLRDL